MVCRIYFSSRETDAYELCVNDRKDLYAGPSRADEPNSSRP